jgi:enoyl-CoA hydratase/carnithine racemase
MKMPYENYKLISIEVRNKIAYATINNPPVNVITLALLEEFVRLSAELEADPDLLVVVLRSANPEFFIAHFDVGAILEFPIGEPPKREDYASGFYHEMCERFRLMDKITIAQIEGRRRVGAGDVDGHAVWRDREDFRKPDGGAAGNFAGRHGYAADAAADRA